MAALQTQKGNIALIMVVILMTMALLLLKALHFYQESARDEFFREKRFFETFNLAESALSWGLTQNWQLFGSIDTDWECLQHQKPYWESCLKHYKGNDFILLGRSFYNDTQYINVYRWVNPLAGSQKVQARENGWLDYCPVKKKGFC
ncbi:YgdB family protein [Providencia sneebia]|uniref:DUF2509 family protein n=1 Tax=Providencia sneebia DSM 19967 TaxID=1141660 RepID=K8WJI2_9GAMM|nr:YgdB family protein [Providencia sneebia]EKT60126.1 hypothetical protein OO7_04844 [Providencia sneebia DSM 19967]